MTEYTWAQRFVTRHISFGTAYYIVLWFNVFLRRILPCIVVVGAIFGAGYLVGAA